ncbi:MAG: LEPR-XLL domain-containing protein [Ramlibacter sp.]
MLWRRLSRQHAPAHETAHAPRPVAEAMEPRILYSADIAAGLMLGQQAGAAEHRTLDASGEYAGTPQSVAAAYAGVALNFEANAGQAQAGIDFLARGSGYDIAL